MLVSGSVCSSLRALACWQWGRECSDMNTSASGLLSAPEDNPPSLAMLMQRIWRASVRAGWTERRGGLFMQQGGLLPHICVGLLLFSLTSGGALGNSEGLHEVCSHVQGSVTSQAEMLKVWFSFFLQSHGRDYLNVKLSPWGKKKDHKLYLVLLIERGSSEIASTPFLKASPPVSCIPVPSNSCRQLGFFLGWGGLSENFLFHEPFSIRSPQSSALIVLTKWRTTAGDRCWLEAEPVPSSPSRSRLPCQNHSQFLETENWLYTPTHSWRSPWSS